MARHKISTTDAEIDAAIERARKLRETLATAVEYKAGPGLDLLVLHLSDGRRHVVPRESIEGLQNATPRQIAQVEILGNGTALRWAELDLDLYVPHLLRNIYGAKRWMAELGRRGGLARSPEKRKASQANGCKGGRPKLTPSIA